MDSEATMILVVDDTPITARWVGYVAGRLGFGAVLAANGEEALNCLAEQPFAAVISDVEMPGMNGFELLQNIRLLYPAMPVILMSAYCNEECRKASRAWGAQALLAKPVSTDQLTELFGGSAKAHVNDTEQRAPVLSVIQ
jgi:CheY-like chemotaxis protein